MTSWARRSSSLRPLSPIDLPNLHGIAVGKVFHNRAFEHAIARSSGDPHSSARMARSSTLIDTRSRVPTSPRVASVRSPALDGCGRHPSPDGIIGCPIMVAYLRNLRLFFSTIGIARGCHRKMFSATEPEDFARFSGAIVSRAGLGRTSSLEWGVPHATFSTVSNRRFTSARPLFSCSAGAKRCRAAYNSPQHALTVTANGSQQDACCVRQRRAEVLCWRRARQWGFSPMPARS